MAIIHFVDGEKGGVGKSLFTRVLVQYFCDRDLSFELIDADPKKDVFLTCGGKSIIFSEAEDHFYDADELFALALKQTIIVNLPSNISEALNGWIERNQILKLGYKHQIKLVKWFVSTGQHESIDEVVTSLNYWKENIPHIIVRNHFKYGDWAEIETDQGLREALEKWVSLRVDMPALSRRERDYLENHRIPFGSINTPPHVQELGILGLMRIQGFLEDTFDSIDSAWIRLTDDAPDASGGTSKRRRNKKANQDVNNEAVTTPTNAATEPAAVAVEG